VAKVIHVHHVTRHYITIMLYQVRVRKIALLVIIQILPPLLVYNVILYA